MTNLEKILDLFEYLLDSLQPNGKIDMYRFEVMRAKIQAMREKP